MPWTRRRKRVVVLVAVLGTVAVAATLVLLTEPITQEQSGYTMIGLRLYAFESVTLFGSQQWLNFTFRGVTFGFHLWCQITPAAGLVCGNATEAGGARYSYSFSDGPPSVGVHWETWVAPDGHEAVQYAQGGLAHLLVST